MPRRSPQMTRRRLMLGFGALPLLVACGQATAPTPAPAKSADAPATAAGKPAVDATKPAAAPAKIDGAPKASEPAAKPAAAVTLTWDTFRGVGTPYPVELIKAFRAKQPNVTLEFRPLPTSATATVAKSIVPRCSPNTRNRPGKSLGTGGVCSPKKSLIWDRAISTAMPLVKPMTTATGMKRISVPSLNRPS